MAQLGTNLGVASIVTALWPATAYDATSGLGGLVFLALWLFLSNALVLTGYRVALEIGDG